MEDYDDEEGEVELLRVEDLREDGAAVEIENEAEVRQGGGDADGQEGEDQVEEEKKEQEPFAVPTAGAFYIRFREKAAALNRYSLLCVLVSYFLNF